MYPCRNKISIFFPLTCFLLFLASSSYGQEVIKLSNGISYSISTENGKPANFFVQEIKKGAVDTASAKRYIIKFKSDPESQKQAAKANGGPRP